MAATEKKEPQLKSDTLQPKEALFVSRYVAHGNASQAARESGFASVGNLLKNPRIRTAIDEEKAKQAKKVKDVEGDIYDAARAMKEAKRAMKFAYATGNANAFVRAVELRSKINGLLVDRIDARMMGMFQLRFEGIDDPPQLAPPQPANPTVLAEAVPLRLPKVEEVEDDEDDFLKVDDESAITLEEKIEDLM